MHVSLKDFTWAKRDTGGGVSGTTLCMTECCRMDSGRVKSTRGGSWSAFMEWNN